jgi:hypothetical protein
MKSLLKKTALLPLVIALMFSASCGDKTQLSQQQDSGLYPQEFAPKYLDVLWVIDNRSPLYDIRAQLTNSAKEFFKRLGNNSEGLAYRMAFTSSDMNYNNGALIPSNYILTGNAGNLESRASLFASILTNQIINLRTGAEAHAFEAAKTTLSSYFKSERNIPLAIVFISDSDDKSEVPSGTTASVVDYYADHFKSLKDSADLVRVYSINYVALASGESTSDEAVATAKRCATRYNADIDKAGFQDRFFALATKMGGKTANICETTWQDDISLDGLQLKQLETHFKLDKKAKPGTITVRITKNGQDVAVPNWTFDEAANEIIFDEPPVGGGVIQVTFVPL